MNESETTEIVADQLTSTRHRRGNIARLSKTTRNKINTMLDDGLSYASVLRPFLLATLKLKFRPVCRERASIFRITGSCRTYPGTVRLLRDGLSLAPQCWGRCL